MTIHAAYDPTIPGWVKCNCDHGLDHRLDYEPRVYGISRANA